MRWVKVPHFITVFPYKWRTVDLRACEKSFVVNNVFLKVKHTFSLIHLTDIEKNTLLY